VDDPGVVKSALEARELLPCIFTDLCKDSPRTLLLLLRTMQQFVVGAPVPRRTKQGLLRAPVLRQLGSLYAYEPPVLQRRDGPGGSGSHLPLAAAAEQHESVRELAHALLLEICTTKSAGVCLPPKVGNLSLAFVLVRMFFAAAAAAAAMRWRAGGRADANKECLICSVLNAFAPLRYPSVHT